MLYRILTEDLNRDKIEREVDKFYPGFTIIETTGYWKGNKEKSIIIELWTADDADHVIDRALVDLIGDRIKVLNNQESVLVQEFACTGRLI